MAVVQEDNERLKAALDTFRGQEEARMREVSVEQERLRQASEVQVEKLRQEQSSEQEQRRHLAAELDGLKLQLRDKENQVSPMGSLLYIVVFVGRCL